MVSLAYLLAISEYPPTISGHFRRSFEFLLTQTQHCTAESCNVQHKYKARRTSSSITILASIHKNQLRTVNTSQLNKRLKNITSARLNIGQYTVPYYTILYCTAQHCTVLYCTVLYCVALYCTVLCRTVLYCTVLCRTVLHSTVLHCTVLYCTAQYCTVLYCNVLYCTVPDMRS